MPDLTVFQVLDQIEKKNYFLWSQLNESEQKQFHPLVLMKWMLASGVPATQLQPVNLNLFALPKEHQFLKLATAGTQTGRRWKWIQKKTDSSGEVLKAIQFVYDTNSRQAEQSIELFTDKELEEILTEYRGYITDTKKESKKRR